MTARASSSLKSKQHRTTRLAREQRLQWATGAFQHIEPAIKLAMARVPWAPPRHIREASLPCCLLVSAICTLFSVDSHEGWVDHAMPMWHAQAEYLPGPANYQPL